MIFFIVFKFFLMEPAKSFYSFLCTLTPVYHVLGGKEIKLNLLTHLVGDSKLRNKHELPAINNGKYCQPVMQLMWAVQITRMSGQLTWSEHDPVHFE